MSRAIAITLAALLLVGCAQLKPDAPYNAQAACEASGGAYSGDGTCHERVISEVVQAARGRIKVMACQRRLGVIDEDAEGAA